MGYVTGTDSRQMTLGVWSVEDEVPRDSPARFIEVFVDSLDLEAMGFEHTIPAPTGRPPYNPYDLVKLYVWGYLNRVRSSRRLMRECRRNIELWFLINRLVPDFRTIADFRKAHRKLLKKIFLIFARACKEMKLMDAETLCLDGTTVHAVNGKKQATSAELSSKKLEYAKAQLAAVEKYLDSTKPEDIQACLHAGILPNCYEGTNIRIEVQSLSNISCFIRHTDGRVTCPMGRELLKQRDTKYGTEYSSREACRTCPNRCTDSKREKHVNIGRNSTYVPVIMYGDPRYPLQQIPDVAQDTPYNHFGKWKRDEKRVMIFIKRDIPKQKLRQQTSEHPFGTIKHYDDGHYFLCKGKEKVTAEFSLSALAYDIRRAINICGGVQKLIDLYHRIAMPKIRKIAEI